MILSPANELDKYFSPISYMFLSPTINPISCKWAYIFSMILSPHNDSIPSQWFYPISHKLLSQSLVFNLKTWYKLSLPFFVR